MPDLYMIPDWVSDWMAQERLSPADLDRRIDGGSEKTRSKWDKGGRVERFTALSEFWRRARGLTAADIFDEESVKTLDSLTGHWWENHENPWNIGGTYHLPPVAMTEVIREVVRKGVSNYVAQPSDEAVWSAHQYGNKIIDADVRRATRPTYTFSIHPDLGELSKTAKSHLDRITDLVGKEFAAERKRVEQTARFATSFSNLTQEFEDQQRDFNKTVAALERLRVRLFVLGYGVSYKVFEKSESEKPLYEVAVQNLACIAAPTSFLGMDIHYNGDRSLILSHFDEIRREKEYEDHFQDQL